MMNENIDLIKILEDCPNEWNLWSPLFGEVKFLRIFGDYIEVVDKIGTQAYFDKLGRYITTYETVNSCMLFPSKDQMEWSKFTAPWYKKDKLVEHKFKVGDWIISSVLGTARIMGVNDSNEYQLEYIDGKQEFSSIDYVNYAYDKWTIKDAKDGDVLCCKSGWICVFKTLNNHTNTFSSYCFMDSDKWFFDIGFDGHTLDKKFINAYNGEIYPATKGQRDTLMKAMNDAGYEWDAEKKELKKFVTNRFDPKTLKPFDKILVRKSNENHDVWFPDFVSDPPDDTSNKTLCMCIMDDILMVIPYNDDTKHLAGTSEEAPVFYRHWED